MLKTKALRKIFITTLSLFLILTIFSISTIVNKKDNTLRTNLEVDNNLDKEYTIYLLNSNNLLVKKRVYIDSESKKDLISKIVNSLMKDKTYNLYGTIPKKTKIREIIIGKKIVTIDFSKELLKVAEDKEKQMVASIVHSILDLGEYDGVSILVEGETLTNYPNSKVKIESVLDKKLPINTMYDITSRNNINKVVVYYVEKIDNDSLYVPVTKYLNDDRDKIKIIVEELTSNYIYESNLMSFLNSKTELLSYNEENNVMYLNFNDYLFDSNDKLLEEVIYTLSYSVFDNYDVEMVMFEVNNELVRSINRQTC